MKLTKRMKSATLQALTINIVLLIMLLVTTAIVYPKSKVFFDKITELETLAKDYDTLSQKWLSFADVKSVSLKHKIWNDPLTKQVLADFDPALFNKNFINTGSTSYSDFLWELNTQISTQKQSPDYIRRDNTLNTILPVYSFWSSANSEVLSDFHFVNYIERLLYTFNLENTWEIGIGTLEKLEDEDSGETQTNPNTNTVTENIYRIPMVFSLVGQKSNIIDFIHFMENVWSINVSESGIIEYSDTFLRQVLEWDDGGASYNIYKNQMSTIDSISFPEYPDSGTTIWWDDLIETIKSTQSRQRYSVDLEISFYVSGVPSYQIQSYIDNFFVNFDELFERIDALSKTVSGSKNVYTTAEQISAVGRVQSLYTLSKNFQDTLVPERQLKILEIDESAFDRFVIYYENLARLENAFNDLESIFTNSEEE